MTWWAGAIRCGAMPMRQMPTGMATRTRVVYRLRWRRGSRTHSPKIESSIARYPNAARGSYTVWPGPNSNTFVSWVVRNTEGFAVELPPVAVGKDWLGWAGTAPPRARRATAFSLAGVLGGTVALREGLELHLLGSTIGLDPDDLAIKLPALGKLSLLDALH
jgi:hypothetical protein